MDNEHADGVFYPTLGQMDAYVSFELAEDYEFIAWEYEHIWENVDEEVKQQMGGEVTPTVMEDEENHSLQITFD
jgi:hypothetical protein